MISRTVELVTRYSGVSGPSPPHSTNFDGDRDHHYRLYLTE